MFKTALRLIKNPSISLHNFSLNSSLSTTIHYKFSSSNYEKLNQSEFSKELGLENEYKNVIKIEKSNEKSSFRISASGFIIMLMIVGGYMFIRIIDNSQRQLLKYKINQWMNIFELNKEKQQSMKQKNLIDHENNLKDIFEKKYKNRSIIDSKFLKYLEDYVENEINSENKQTERKEFSIEMLKLIDQVREKFETVKEEKIVNKITYLFNIVEKITYFNLNSNVNNDKIIPKDQKEIFKNFAKFLLKKGNLNHQILGFKYLLITQQSEPLSKIISKEEIEQIKERLQINHKICQDSLKIIVPKSTENESKEENEAAKKLYSIKEEIFYSISELKKANEIRRNKINFLNDILEKIAVENTKKK